MKARLELNGMHFHSFHGCLAEEREKGGGYIVDFSCLRDITDAAVSDKLGDTTDYSEIYSIVEAQMAVPSNLIEHAAARIMSAITDRYPELEDVVIKLTKLSPPVGAEVDSSSVTLSHSPSFHK